eukprot:TRINITY_DN66496_c3_g2_i2.p2 TRINITY_DN66496_c3_g2~~TRINITY_DN66496_c3_g2_i2.p2  ORF type:complete len:522 (-),score=234.76 TRINITY_DN66496_c3_g2_i2:2008-3405(-)
MQSVGWTVFNLFTDRNGVLQFNRGNWQFQLYRSPMNTKTAATELADKHRPLNGMLLFARLVPAAEGQQIVPGGNIDEVLHEYSELVYGPAALPPQRSRSSHDVATPISIIPPSRVPTTAAAAATATTTTGTAMAAQPASTGAGASSTAAAGTPQATSAAANTSSTSTAAATGTGTPPRAPSRTDGGSGAPSRGASPAPPSTTSAGAADATAGRGSAAASRAASRQSQHSAASGGAAGAEDDALQRAEAELRALEAENDQLDGKHDGGAETPQGPETSTGDGGDDEEEEEEKETAATEASDEPESLDLIDEETGVGVMVESFDRDDIGGDYVRIRATLYHDEKVVRNMDDEEMTWSSPYAQTGVSGTLGLTEWFKSNEFEQLPYLKGTKMVFEVVQMRQRPDPLKAVEAYAPFEEVAGWCAVDVYKRDESTGNPTYNMGQHVLSVKSTPLSLAQLSPQKKKKKKKN